MAPETRVEIYTLVRSGFYTKGDLMQVFCEEMYEPGELVPTEVSAALDLEFQRLVDELPTWPAVTDCDRLDKAFLAINGRRIIALQNAGNTQNDGYDDFVQELDEAHQGETILGYCFYHGQDLERAVGGGGLYLAFGPTDHREEATKGLEVGRIVQEELLGVGLPVEWDGSFAKRIFVPRLTWQRRPITR